MPRNNPARKQIRFVPWSSSFVFSSEGKHVIDFNQAFPLAFGCHRFSFDHRLTPNYHDYLEISSIAFGTGTFLVGDRTYEVSKGDLVVLGNTEIHTLLTSRSDPVDVISLFFMPELIYRPGGNELDFEYLRFFYTYSYAHSNCIKAGQIDSHRVGQLLENAYWLMQAGGTHHDLMVKNCLLEILVLLLEYYESSLLPDTTHYDRRLADIRRLNPVFRLIEARYHEPVSLRQAAEAAHMSAEYFCRFFKRVTGNTLIQYVQRTRIDKAKQLLLSQNLSITQVAFEVGFDNLSYFYRVFRSLVNLTPTEFLRRIEKGGSA